MTRKDYVAIAEAINVSSLRGYDPREWGQSYLNGREDALTVVARNIADVMQADNPRFDRSRFLKACGVTA